MHVSRRVVLAWVTVLSVAALCVPRPAFAWGPRGHKIIARLAEARLAPQALAEVQRLLATRGAHHLADVAAWADDLRDIDPALFRRTRHLHYINFHSSTCVYDPQRDCRGGKCVVAAIYKYSAILANRTLSDAQRADALAFVVHFVGDIHQPLHAGYRHDAGGNDFQVRWQGEGTNLHRVWDSLMLDTADLSSAAYARKLAAETSHVEAGGAPAEWAEESCRIDRDGGVYPSSHFIDQAYVERELPIAEMRLRQAGARLAQMLNRDLGNTE